MEDLYRENIMDHYKSPRNFGKLEGADIVFNDYNPLCGDEVTLYVKTGSDQIKEVKFEGRGCALSMASASILTEELNGKSLSEVRTLTQEAVLKMVGVDVSPSRIKCVMLALSALKKGMITSKVKENVA